MERERGTKILTVFAICIAIVGMTIGFATFQTVLKLEGSAEVKGNNWGVIFSDLSSAALTGSAAEASGGTPTIKENSTKISNYQVELTLPGDSVSYTFKIKNQGSLDAEIASISIAGTEGKPFVVSGGDATDQTNVKNNLTYTLTYVGGAKNGQNLAVGDVIPKKTGGVDGEVTVMLKLQYNNFSDASLLPKATVSIDNLGIDLTYRQS